MVKKTSWAKWLLFLLIAAILGGGGYYFWKKSQSETTEYRTAPITRGEIVQAVTASGQLNPVVTVQVGSQVSGIIKNLYVDFNSHVTNGQIVAQLDPSTFEATVHQTEAQLASAQAAAELDKLNADRAEALYKDHLLAKADYDKAIADLHQAEAAVKIQEANLEKAKVDLSRTTIFSTIDGEVISREVDVGQTVAASLNAPVLFRIANNLAKMQIDAMVSEADIGGVEKDQDVKFTVDAFPTRTFHGKVIQVRNSPITNQNVVSYDTVVEVNNRDLKLKPGMTATVAIVVAQKENVLKIPNGALRFRPPESETKSDEPKKMAQSASASTNSTGTNIVGTNVSVATSQSPGGREGRSRSRSGGSGGGRGGTNAKHDHAGPKTVYVAEKSVVNGKTVVEPKAVQIQTGITDNISTEVISGLKEGDEVILNVVIPESESSRPTSNPFSSGRRHF
jgi:HlyD family secretion protein